MSFCHLLNYTYMLYSLSVFSTLRTGMLLIIKYKVKVTIFKSTTFFVVKISERYQGAAEKEKLGHCCTMRY